MRAIKYLFGLILLGLSFAFGLAAQPETPVEEYAARRARLVEAVGGPVLIFGYEQKDLEEISIFHQEPNFFYLSGHEEPRAALLLVPQTDRAKAAGLPAEILFTPSQNRRSVVYDGLSVFPDTEGVEERTGFVAVEPVEELKDVLEKAARVFPLLYTLLPARPGEEVDSLHAQRWRDWLQTELPGVELADIRRLVNSMRVIKSPREIEAERWTNEVTRAGHLAAMRSIRPGMVEHELAAAMEYEFRREGCRPGYGSIVGSGPNSVILHYNAVNRKMEAGEVVVLDVAASCGNYTSDITRTLPVSGKFTKRQRQIYEIVLGAQQAAIAAVKPGMMLGGRGENSLNRIAREYIQKKGEEMGEDLQPYILHGLGHYVGLQVHDVGSYGRPLEAGMIITIEPGIYIAAENLGVRIEDVILVTEDGYEVLSDDIPKTIAEIERILIGQLGRTQRSFCIEPSGLVGYPPIGLQASIQGDVELRVTIGRSGRVKGVNAVSGHPVLALAASQTVSSSRFGCFQDSSDFPMHVTVLVKYKLVDRIEGVTRPWKVSFRSPRTIVFDGCVVRLHQKSDCWN